MSDHQRAAQHAPYEGEAARPCKRPRTTMTGGRTRPRYQLALEALVNTTASPAQLTTLRPEEQKICYLCRETKVVAEVSALLSIPLQRVRALIADLAGAGLVTIGQPGGTQNAGGTPDAALIERVLSGLRRDTAEVLDTEDAQDGSVEEWLADSYREFADALGDVLDTEGGLREILLQSDHDTAVDGLGDLLDIEAGLREALGVQLERGTATSPSDLPTGTEPLWSYKEIAAHIGVQMETVRSYRKHGLLPPPDVVDEGKPYWFADTVRAWAARRVNHRHRQDPND